MEHAAELHRKMLDLITVRDFARLRELLHDDYVYMAGDGLEQPGPGAGVRVAETHIAAFPDLTFEVRNQYAPSESVSIIEFTARGTHRGDLPGVSATGREVEIVICDVIEARDGKIYREREYYDGMTLMQQLGALPEEATVS